MATKNDVTGDNIQSKVNSQAYKDNWDLVFGKKKDDQNEAKKDEIGVVNDEKNALQ